MPGLSRRRFVAGAVAAAGAAGSSILRPYLSRAADRPNLTHGLQSGDVSASSGVVWARADRPARLEIEVATAESFRDILRTVAVDALPESDLTAKVVLDNLPAGQDIFYRVIARNHAESTVVGEAQVGCFRTAPADRRSVSFVWSGDTAGQGWGIDEARGGMRTYAAMLARRPDFFIHSGDTIYADNPIPAERRLPGGEVWRNLVTEEKSKPAEALADFRGNYKYNLLDRNVRAFNAAVPMLAQWDDHEVVNDWWPGMPTRRGESMAVMVARAARAFHEYTPIRPEPTERDRVFRKIAYGPLLDIFMIDMRSYRGPNGDNRQVAYGPASHLLGPAQVAWLKRELKASRATWKAIAADLPIGILNSDGMAQGDDGAPLGRELEIADLLSFMKREKVRNAIWLTADVHYTAAHYYDPNKAQFQDFEPFWELVSGPIHAGTFGPETLDATFGPQVVFMKVPTREQGLNLSPFYGLQFFGHVAIDGRTEQLTVTLRDCNDAALWSMMLDPQR